MFPLIFSTHVQIFSMYRINFENRGMCECVSPVETKKTSCGHSANLVGGIRISPEWLHKRTTYTNTTLHTTGGDGAGQGQERGLQI